MLFVAGPTRDARANGRFPRAERLIEQNDDPQSLVLAATYGLLVTSDRGGDWRHICELGFAFSIDDIDPVIELPPDGSFLVTTSYSLNRSTAGFCDFETVLGGKGAEIVRDLTHDHSDRNHVLALVVRNTDVGVLNLLYESTDAGRSFHALGSPLADFAFAVTLDVAPSDPNRIYVSGAGVEEPQILASSDDRGATWTTIRLPIDAEEYPYIAAVHPTNANMLYLRTDFWTQRAGGPPEANDGLFYSDDGGQTWREIHRAAGKLFGFALSPDGGEVLIGYGDPVEPSQPVDPTALGIYRASTSDHLFTKILDGSVSCLSWTAEGVYVCTSQEEYGFALGFAPNADFDLDTRAPLVPLLDLTKVKGPLDCPACSSGAACGSLWSENCAVFGSCDAGATTTNNAPDMDCSNTGSSGTPALSSKGPSEDSSCSCHVVGSRVGAGLDALPLLIAALGARYRRRPRRFARVAPCDTGPVHRRAS